MVCEESSFMHQMHNLTLALWGSTGLHIPKTLMSSKTKKLRNCSCLKDTKGTTDNARGEPGLDPGSRGKCYTGHYCNSLELCTSWEHPIHVTLSWIWSFCWGYLRAGPWGRGEEWEKNVRKGWGENTHVVKMWAISDSRCVATPFILFRHFLLIWKFQKVKLKFFHTLLLYVFL